MFSHIVVGTNNLDRAKDFYSAVFSTLGYQNVRESEVAYIFVSDRSFFRVTKPINGEPATHANGGHYRICLRIQ